MTITYKTTKVRTVTKKTIFKIAILRLPLDLLVRSRRAWKSQIPLLKKMNPRKPFD